jgi:hypothetical protein
MYSNGVKIKNNNNVQVLPKTVFTGPKTGLYEEGRNNIFVPKNCLWTIIFPLKIFHYGRKSPYILNCLIVL